MPISKNRRKNGKKPPPVSTKKVVPPAPTPPLPLPDRSALEGVMTQITGASLADRVNVGGGNALSWAQNMMYEASDADNKHDKIRWCR